MQNDEREHLERKLRLVGEELERIRFELPERKTERIQLRVTPTEKREVQEATELLGISESDYLMHLHRRAMRELERRMGREVGSKSEGGRRPRFRRGDHGSSGTPVRPGR